MTPNKVDYDVVFTELQQIHETGNVAVLCTIIATMLLYLLVCIFARKADKKDQAKVKMISFRLQLQLFCREVWCNFSYFLDVCLLNSYRLQ